MRDRAKRILAALLSVAMIAGSIPSSVFADTVSEPVSVPQEVREAVAKGTGSIDVIPVAAGEDDTLETQEGFKTVEVSAKVGELIPVSEAVVTQTGKAPKALYYADETSSSYEMADLTDVAYLQLVANTSDFTVKAYSDAETELTGGALLLEVKAEKKTKELATELEYNGRKIVIKAEVPEEANIPENTVLKVTEKTEGTDAFETAVEEVDSEEEKKQGENELRLVDYAVFGVKLFTIDGGEIKPVEPEAEINFTVNTTPSTFENKEFREKKTTMYLLDENFENAEEQGSENSAQAKNKLAEYQTSNSEYGIAMISEYQVKVTRGAYYAYSSYFSDGSTGETYEYVVSYDGKTINTICVRPEKRGISDGVAKSIEVIDDNSKPGLTRLTWYAYHPDALIKNGFLESDDYKNCGATLSSDKTTRDGQIFIMCHIAGGLAYGESKNNSYTGAGDDAKALSDALYEWTKQAPTHASGYENLSSTSAPVEIAGTEWTADKGWYQKSENYKIVTTYCCSKFEIEIPEGVRFYQNKNANNGKSGPATVEVNSNEDFHFEADISNKSVGNVNINIEVIIPPSGACTIVKGNGWNDAYQNFAIAADSETKVNYKGVVQWRTADGSLTKVGQKNVSLKGTKIGLYEEGASTPVVEKEFGDGADAVWNIDITKDLKDVQPNKEYQIKETKTGNGYKLPVEPVGTFKINYDETNKKITGLEITINDSYKANINDLQNTLTKVSFTKEDWNNSFVNNATLEIYSGESKIASWVTGAASGTIESGYTSQCSSSVTADGQVWTVEGLTANVEYTLRETSAPKGYTLKTIDFKVDEYGTAYAKDGNTWTPMSENVITMENERTKMQFAKVDADDPTIYVAGATLAITDADGNIIDLAKLLEGVDISGYGIQGAEGEEPVTTLEWVTTDTPVTVIGLPVGTYHLVERKAPDGYVLNTTPVEFIVTDSDKESVAEPTVITIKDEKTKVELNKVFLGADWTTDVTAAVDPEMAGLQLVLKGKNAGGEGISESAPFSAIEGKLFEKLLISYPEADEYVYTLEEVESTLPKGYTAADPVRFTLDENGDLVVVKDDLVRDHAHEDAKTNAEVTEAVKDTSTGFVKKPQTLTLHDYKIKFQLQKKDERGNNLAGAEFLLKWTMGTSGKFTAGAQKTITLDENGYAEVSDPDIKWGVEYTLEETKAPTGYVYADPITFTIDKNGLVTITKSDKNTSVNADNRIEIDIVDKDTKLDVLKTLTDLAGSKVYSLKDGEQVVFTLVGPGAGGSANITVTGTKADGDYMVAVEDRVGGTVTVTLTEANRDANASLATYVSRLIRNLPAGTYTVNETVVPAGFTKMNTATVTVSDKLGGDGEAQVAHVEVRDTATQTDFQKFDSSSNPLGGVTLQILDANGNVVTNVFGERMEWVTNGSTHRVEGLVPGTYYLHEAYAPTGYAYSSDREFTISDGSEAGSVFGPFSMSDMELHMRVSKVELEDNAIELDGAEMTLYYKSSDGTLREVSSWTSKAGEYHDFGSVLNAGANYVLREEVAAAGHHYTSDIEFSVSLSGTVTTTAKRSMNEAGQTVYLVEDAATVVRIQKVDAETGEALAGARLQITDKDGKVVETWTTDGTPHELKAKLNVREDYTLTELEAPKFFDVAEPVTFQVSETEDVTNVTMQDKRTFSEDATIRVTKTLVSSGDGNPVNAVDETFYVALFDDEARTHRVSDVKAIEFKNGSSTTVEFRGLELGKTYYIGEVTEDGVLALTGTLADGSTYEAKFNDGYSAVIEQPDGTVEVHFENEMYTMPDRHYYREGELIVTKRMLSASDEPMMSDEVFYAGIFEDAEHTTLSDRVSQNFVRLALDGGSEVSETIQVTLEPEQPLNLYVTEVDENGREVETGNDFIYSFSVDKNEVTVTEDGPATVTITNKPELTHGYYNNGELTITKILLGADGREKAGRGVFYAGIFDDPEYTHLSEIVSANIVELNLNGNSRATDAVEVSLEPGQTVTLYVTEVNADGVPVAGSASFQYDVSVEGAVVEMTNETAGVTTITNQERDDEEIESESEEIESETTVSQKSVKTGDDTPIALYLALMAAAAAALLILIGARRKRNR